MSDDLVGEILREGHVDGVPLAPFDSCEHNGMIEVRPDIRWDHVCEWENGQRREPDPCELDQDGWCVNDPPPGQFEQGYVLPVGCLQGWWWDGRPHPNKFYEDLSHLPSPA